MLNKEYRIQMEGGQDFIILSPEMIALLLERVKHSDTKKLVIPVEDIISPGYAEYLVHVICANMEIGQICFQKKEIYYLTARQIEMLKVKQQQCFDRVDVITEQSNTQFDLDTDREFFLLIKQSYNNVVYLYECGEEQYVLVDYCNR